MKSLWKWLGLEEHHREWQAHRQLLNIIEYSIIQQKLKIERKDEIFLLQEYYTFIVLQNLLCMMDFKSIVSSSGKLHFGLDPNDDTMDRYLVGILMYWVDILYFMLTTKHMFGYLWGTLE